MSTITIEYSAEKFREREYSIWVYVLNDNELAQTSHFGYSSSQVIAESRAKNAAEAIAKTLRLVGKTPIVKMAS